MVKLRGPSLSAAASGTIGDIATFSSAKGRAYLKRKPTPAQPRSGPQLSMRAMMQFLSQQWQNLQPAKQATWANAYPDPQLNNYNAFLRYNLERWRRRAPPTKEYPAAEDNNPSDSVTLTLTGAIRHVDLTVRDTSGFPDNWTILIFHSDAAEPDPNFENLIHVVLVEDGANYYWTHSPLAAGTHHYKITAATDDGNTDWTREDHDSAVVT